MQNLLTGESDLMNRLIYHGILLAQSNRWDDMSSRFRGRRARISFDDVVLGLVILGGAVAALWGLSLLLRLQERRRGHANPLGLFLSLCKAHRLRWPQRWLLWRIARSFRLRDPAQLFVRPELFDPANLGSSFQSRAAELKRLHGLLFVEPKPEEDEEGPNAPSRRQPKESSDTQHGAALPSGESPSPTGASPALDIAPWPPASGFGSDVPTGSGR